MLGTNDLKMRFSVPAFDIAKSAGVLVDIVQRSDAGLDGGAPKVLLVAPPPLGTLTEFAEMFEGGAAKSQKFAMHYQRVAQEFGCDFMDASGVINSSDIDGVHFESSEHRKLGQAVAELVRKIFSKR